MEDLQKVVYSQILTLKQKKVEEKQALIFFQQKYTMALEAVATNNRKDFSDFLTELGESHPYHPDNIAAAVKMIYSLKG